MESNSHRIFQKQPSQDEPDAIDDEAIQRAELEEAVERGFVRPSLLYQVDQRVFKKEELPPDVSKADAPFADYCRSVHHAIVEGFRR